MGKCNGLMTSVGLLVRTLSGCVNCFIIKSVFVGVHNELEHRSVTEIGGWVLYSLLFGRVAKCSSQISDMWNDPDISGHTWRWGCFPWQVSVALLSFGKEPKRAGGRQWKLGIVIKSQWSNVAAIPWEVFFNFFYVNVPMVTPVLYTVYEIL